MIMTKKNSKRPPSEDGQMRHRAAAEILQLTEENRLLKIENQTLHGWIKQQDEFIERLSAAARKGKT